MGVTSCNVYKHRDSLRSFFPANSEMTCLFYVHEGSLMKAISHQTLCSEVPFGASSCHFYDTSGSWVQFYIGVVQRLDQGLEIAIFTHPPEMTPPSDLSFEIIERHVHVFSIVAIYGSNPFF